MSEVLPKYTFSIDSGKLGVSIISPTIFRIRYTVSDNFSQKPSLCVVSQDKKELDVKYEENQDYFKIRTSKMFLKIDKRSGKCVIYDYNSKILLQEGIRTLKSARISGEDVFSIHQEFSWEKDEALYGLGQFQDGIMNWRGHIANFIQKNTVAVNPMLISSKGFGILWHNTSFSKFVDNTKESYFWSEVADEIDYFFIYGPSTDDVISGYRTLTGKAPMLGKWAFGYIQCKERYTTQEELLAVVKKYRELNIPLDVIVQDWKYWTGDQWGQKSFDPTRFPDPEGMIKELHEKWKVHIMISIWPKLHPSCPDFEEMNKNPDHLYKGSIKSPIYDAFSKKAQEIYWDQANRGLFSKGIDSWWCDATEPEVDPGFNNFHRLPKLMVKRLQRRMQPALGSAARYLNAYSLMQAKGIYENQRKTTEEKRVVNLTRSAFLGQQRYSAITWSGDTKASWDVFKKQITAGLNFCLSGIPYWTHDIGGFFVQKYRGGCQNEEYRELYTRWFQFGVFSPLFRAHGTNTPRELWQFGEPGTKYYDVLLKMIKLRYSLMPYIYSLAGKVTQEDYTMMRGLIFDFPNDPKVYDITDQYMFGPSILVCPVVEPKTALRDVYLPQFTDKNRKWIDYWSRKQYNSGQNISVDAPLDQIPLFVPTGSILPCGPEIQYGTESCNPMEIRIYSGQDAEFTLYEDENDNYNYEKGKFSLIKMRWTEKSHTFSINKREGKFPGMLHNRNFKIRVDEESKTFLIQYDGSLMEI